jgi:nitrate reductase gamma subunit
MQLVLLFMYALTFFFPLPAYGYVGPGLGLSAIGAILGVLFSVFLALFALFWYPIKRLIGKFRKMSQKKNDL